MRRSIRVVALATLLASCSDLPQQPVMSSDLTSVGGTAHLPDLQWGRSTTNVPMFVMGTHNGRNVIPLDVNDAGVIVGILRAVGVPDRAFRWENGTFTDIGPATGVSVAKAISDAGTISGYAGLTGVIWTSSGMTPLLSSSNGSQAGGLNEAGIVTGADFLSASRWASPTSRLDLPKPSGSTAVAFDVNNNGVISGRITATSPPFGRPFLWQNSTGTQVIMPPVGYSLTNPHAFQGGKTINDAGNWIGNLQNGGTIRGFRHRNGVFETLPVLSTAMLASYALGVGENGEVVGTSPFAVDEMHAVVWAVDNTIRDLGLVTGATGTTANAVNRGGWVVGTSASSVDGATVTVGVIWRITGDDTPPVVGVTVEGTQGENEWYTSDVQVHWSMTDPESGIQSSQGCQAQGVFADTPGVTYTCTATNTAGLATTQSVTIKRDASQPVIANTVTGTMGTNDWYRSDVNVNLTVTDAQSGIATAEGCVETNVVEDTAEMTFTCSATNGAGLFSSTSVTIKRDATNPVITFGAHDKVFDVDGHITIPCEVSDALSGVASHNCATLDADAFRLAIANHNHTIRATDNAGNTVTASTSFSVQVTLAGLANLTRTLVENEGVANALVQKLENAANQLDKGSTKAANQMMDAYESQLRALDGEKIAPGDAEILMQLSNLVPMDASQAALKKTVRW
jgi:hypothetical protein